MNMVDMSLSNVFRISYFVFSVGNWVVLVLMI